VAHDVLIHADDLDAVQPVRVADQHTPALGVHGVVSGVPRNTQCFSDSGDPQVLSD
jgi:hypothetical protein